MAAPQYSEEQINTIYQAAQKFSDVKKFDEAEKAFQIVLQAMPNHPHVQSSYGKHCVNQRKFAQAEKYLKAAIKTAPNDIYVLLDLAAFYGESEDYKNYVPTLKKALSIDPTNSYVIINFAYYLLLKREYAELKKLRAEAAKQKLEIADEEILRVSQAIVSYLENDWQKCESLLADMPYFLSDEAIALEDKFPLRRTFRAYHNYMLLLIEWRKNHLQYYSAKPLPKVYIVGDSHSFGAANCVVHLNNQPHMFNTKLVADTSAWLVSNPERKLRRQVLKEALSGLEKGAKVLISFGEIDCRPNLGIHKHHLKNPQKNLQKSIGDLVESYVSMVAKYAKNRELKAHLINCPAPLESAIREQIVGDENIEAYKKIAPEFNAQLAQQAAKYHLEVVDLYAATHGKDGWSKEGIHLDNAHFQPNILADWLNK